ncbi:reverse transcriptase domain-containing protein [Tanacetum coccineum]
MTGYEDNEVVRDILKEINSNLITTTVKTHGANPVHTAARFGNLEALEMMVDSNPDCLFFLDKDGKLAIDYAHDVSELETFIYLFKQMKSSRVKFDTLLREGYSLKLLGQAIGTELIGEKRLLQLHELDELRLQAYKNSKLYKARTKAYHDKKLRIRKDFKAGDKLYDKHKGSFIVNGHRVKLYHNEKQLNELTSEKIHLMCEEGKMKAIPFMTPFLAYYRKTMPWVVEKPFIYSVVENTCNKAKLYDLDETGEGIITAGDDARSIWSLSAISHARMPGLLLLLFPYLCFDSFCRVEGNAKLKYGE